MKHRIESVICAALLLACGSSNAKRTAESSTDGGASGGNATPSGCAVSVTGAVEGGLMDCLASAQHLTATNETTVQIVATDPSGALQLVAFKATLGHAPLAAQTYTTDSVVDANTEVSVSDGSSYYQSIHDDAGALNDQGELSLKVTDIGTSISAGDSSHNDGNGWVNIHGSLNATLPADPDGAARGAVTVQIAF